MLDGLLAIVIAMPSTKIELLPIAGHRFEQMLSKPLVALSHITKLQINLGLVCNLACRHCHVESSPRRTAAHENMAQPTAERILDWVERHPQITTVDLTGGSPEMNPNFQLIVQRCVELGRQVMNRCNPTILTHVDKRSGKSYDWVPPFLAEHRVQVVASLPCYLEDNVRYQRGLGAYDASIDGLRMLNAVGYGFDPQLSLHLVYNPNGPHLPPEQAKLADDYRRELKQRFDIQFNELWTIANMPIKRWRDDLERKGQLADYMSLLAGAFNPATVDQLMCRSQIHVDSEGRIFDCDFNYALNLPASATYRYLWQVELQGLQGRPITTGDHCFGCTAGSGSSCGGQLA